MSREAVIEYLGASFRDACLSLFSHGGCDINPTEAHSMDYSEMPVASVDGGSSELEVLITLNMPYSALAMTYPVQSVTNTSEEELEDWIAELVNRLLGKFNERITASGHYLRVGLPQNQVGSVYAQEPLESGHMICHYFDIDGEIFCASLCVELFSENFNIEQDDTGQHGVNGGELELF